MSSKHRRPRGRPPTTHALPPRVDGTPEELVQAFFNGKPSDDMDFAMTYHCVSCERTVHFPEILYQDKRCRDCRRTPVE